MTDPRITKRIIIGLVFLSGLSLFSFFVYKIVSPEKTCFDGKQNQNEKGVDCGGICAPCRNLSETLDLKVMENSFVFGGNDTYDGLIKISNPNLSVGSPSFSYRTILRDANGNIIDEKTGQAFILPAETKYIAILGFSVARDENPAKLDFEISDMQWQEFIQYQKPQLNTYSKRFNLLSDMVGGEAYGVLKNESGFDFNVIRVAVILRDRENKLLALNTTQMNTVRSGEERDLKLTWPYQIQGEVINVEMEAEADTYNSQNFIKTYIPEQKLPFQQY